jgi:hypothetical protein
MRHAWGSSRTVTIHDYKLLELHKMSMIGPERYAEAMKIAPGQQRFRGAFTKKPSMELLSISPLDHLTYVA